VVTPYFSDEAVTLYHGDSLAVLRTLPDASVDCCVTSPPYFGLRDYGEVGQYGLESSPAEYVETMRAVFAEVRRVLADDGTLWLNLGDSYYSGKGNPGPNSADEKQSARRGWVRSIDKPGQSWGRRKSLLGIPWRVAFALMDDGWILRQEVIWHKTSCTPEAVKDRPSRVHEQVFLLTKRPTYWYDADAIRGESDPEQVAHNRRHAKESATHTARAAATGQPGNINNVGIHARPGSGKPNAKSVWDVGTVPFAAAHFAVFPPTLAERCVRAGCKPGGTVLDPFSGSGTTGLAAAKHGRKYVGIDLNADYLDLSLRTRLGQAALLDGGVA
jgi:DNA modification methylase